MSGVVCSCGCGRWTASPKVFRARPFVDSLHVADALLGKARNAAPPVPGARSQVRSGSTAPVVSAGPRPASRLTHAQVMALGSGMQRRVEKQDLLVGRTQRREVAVPAGRPMTAAEVRALPAAWTLGMQVRSV